MSNYSRLVESCIDAGYSKEGWVSGGEGFDTYSVSMVIDDMAKNMSNPQRYAQQAEDKYMRISSAALALIKEIKDMYLDEVLDYENKDSNLAKLHNLVHNHHY